jgi:CcmD family protein
MSLLASTPLGSTLPSNDGYVAAAYIVFFVLLLVYLAIMGVRLTRMERRLCELRERAGGEAGEGGDEAASLDGADVGERQAASGGGSREEELV